MKTLAAIVTLGLFLSLSLAPAAARQDGKRKEGPPDGGERKGPPSKEGDRKGPPPGDRKCGFDAGGYEEDLKRRGIGKEECDRAAKEHFKKHPDGVCHCFCNHDDGPKPPKKPGPPRDGDGDKKPVKPGVNDGDGGKKPPVKCCCDATGYHDNLKRKGYEKDECERITKEHFKKHPDGICHCSCSHDDDPRPPKKPGPPPDGGGDKKPIGEGDGGKKPEKKCGHDCGAFKEELKRRAFGNDDQCERHAKDHFKSHPDGICHCFCNHDDDGGKEGGGKDGHKDNRKGNNGVGNGQDPQPPGKPPVNDGPGTGPGNPGNKKGGK